jgi:hypothetical protein
MPIRGSPLQSAFWPHFHAISRVIRDFCSLDCRALRYPRDRYNPLYSFRHGGAVSSNVEGDLYTTIWVPMEARKDLVGPFPHDEGYGETVARVADHMRVEDGHARYLSPAKRQRLKVKQSDLKCRTCLERLDVILHVTWDMNVGQTSS